MGSGARLSSIAMNGKAVAMNMVYYRRPRSPIPAAPAWLLRAIGGTDLILPPPALMQPGGLGLDGLVTVLGVARCLNLDRGTVLEIGTATGLTSLALAKNLPGGRIFTLDLPGLTEPTFPVGRHDHPLASGDMRRVFTGTDESERITQLVGDSATFDFKDLKRSCDIVLVDGAHSAEYIAKDTATALDLVTDTGAIVWDDYWFYAPDVVRYLDSRRDLRLYRVPSTRLIVWFTGGALERLRSADRAAIQAKA